MKDDLDIFANCLKGLAEVFEPDRAITPLRVELYFQALKGYPVGKIEAAAKRLIKTREFSGLPKPAEIIKEIEGGADDNALAAWLTVIKAVIHSPVGQGKVDDPIACRAVEAMGGWYRLQSMTNRNEPFIQKEFERTYRMLASDTDGKYIKLGVPDEVKSLIKVKELK